MFFAKSAEAIEKKRVEFLARAKKCKRVQKSAQKYEKKGDRSKHVGTFEGLNVGSLKKKKLANQSQRLKTKKRRRGSDDGHFRGGGIEHSRPMVTRVILFVNYKYSTSI